jgi:hypothetical protein
VDVFAEFSFMRRGWDGVHGVVANAAAMRSD